LRSSSSFKTANYLSKLILSESLDKQKSELRTALFWCHYAASRGNFLPAFRDNLSVPSSGVKNPKQNYHYSLRNDPEERSSHLLRDGSLKARRLLNYCNSPSNPPPQKKLYKKIQSKMLFNTELIKYLITRWIIC